MVLTYSAAFMLLGGKIVIAFGAATLVVSISFIVIITIINNDPIF